MAVLGLLALFALGLCAPAFAQTLTITSPLDQAWLDLSNGEYFDVSWTCDYSTTEVELWVDGRAYCSYCGSGYSGTISGVDSWMTPPFQDQCWHVLQLKAIVGAGWVYSVPILIRDTTYFGSYPCPPPPNCATSWAGKPVDVASGKMYADQEDLRIEGPLPIVFARTYNQRLKASNGPFGYGWTHAYNMTVWVSYNAAHFRDAEGHETIFAGSQNAYAGRDHLLFTTITGGYRVTTT